MATDPTSEPCSWCAASVGTGDGYRVGVEGGARRAVFCRLEHVVPWAMQGAHWEAGEPDEPGSDTSSIDTCARCEQPLAGIRVTLVRHRGEHRIPDAFCSVDDLAAWANAGGRYGRPS